MFGKAKKIILPEEKNLITTIQKRHETARDARKPFEKQWIANIMFLAGKHHFEMSNTPTDLESRIAWEIKNLQNKNKELRSSNYILPLYRSLLSRFMRQKAHIHCDPFTNLKRDIDGAKVSQESLEHFWETVNEFNPELCKVVGMQRILLKLFAFQLCCGRGYLYPYFNADSNARIYLEDKIQELPAGIVETVVVSPFDLDEEPLNRWKIFKSTMDIERIEDVYNVSVKAEDIVASEAEKLIASIYGDNLKAKVENAAVVFEQWTRPTKKKPNGGLVIATKDKLLHEGEIPDEYKGRIPFFSFDYIDIPMSPYPQGAIEQVIDLQRDYNYTLRRIYAYKKNFAGKVLVPKGSKISAKYNDVIGQVVSYESTGGKPQFQDGLSAPESLYKDLARIKKDMEDILGVHDISIGQVPSGIKSGVALEELSEKDNSQSMPVMIEQETGLEQFSRCVVDIQREKYTLPRIVGITGLVHEVQTFKGTDLEGEFRINISLGSGMPDSRQARQDFILKLKSEQIITPELAREYLEFGDLDKALHPVDEQEAKNDIQAMLKGSPVRPEAFNDHIIRLKVVTDFMKTEDFRKQEEGIKMLFRQWLEQTQMHLSQEMQAKQMQQQPPGAA